MRGGKLKTSTGIKGWILGWKKLARNEHPKKGRGSKFFPSENVSQNVVLFHRLILLYFLGKSEE